MVNCNYIATVNPKRTFSLYFTHTNIRRINLVDSPKIHILIGAQRSIDRKNFMNVEPHFGDGLLA
jgi:hypothetical protein